MSAGHRAKRSVLRSLVIGAVALAVVAPASVAKADPTLAEIEAQLEKSGNELEDLVEAYNKINVELAATQAAAATLQTKLQPLADSMATANANVDVIAVAAFKGSGPLQNLNVVLHAQSSDSLIDQLTTLQQISKHQQHEIADATAAKSKLDEEKKKIDETLAAENAQKAELETKKKKIEGDVKKLEELRRRATTAGGTGSTGVKVALGAECTSPANAPVAFACAQLGEPYHWGSAGPSSWDCSGLTMMAWKQAGVSLDHNAARQWNQVTHVSRSALSPGDLAFFRGLGHVGIYIGNGKMIHAPTTGRNVEVALIDKRTDTYGFGRPHK
ncbi:C40 family peptidase [Dactylosporangium aurantiacum]|uniref:C40 family peptidase n=1 Tax=Dactylosporangium aurantiacum TaxID=35754 RepID=A0A9Q9MIA9_9ACTN|nr:C40 family peptidase [Dactylosporangium aurantiacum]MDG6104781.1 NlpC/P60 family protein [Dactylosporangium aurantiacum]UWZ55660.1 C40 family peptidase [Dactylosporangium aurantiacum]